MIPRSQFVCSLLVYFAAAAIVSAQAQDVIPTTEDIIPQMIQAQVENRSHFLPYVATREYELFGWDDHNQAKSRVVAEMIVAPPDSKQYTVTSTSGSAWGEQVVRKMLEGEVVLAKDSGSTDITNDNYEFRFMREDVMSGRRCYVLELLPKRKSKNLLRGTIWVDASTYLLNRVEGRPAKSPSWWLKDVRIVLVYGHVGPMWLQTSWEATANVRIVGQSTLSWQNLRYQVQAVLPGDSLAQTVSTDK